MPQWVDHVRPRLSLLRLSPAREHESVEELSQHLEDRWREPVAGGTPEDEATRLALTEFREGNLLARYMAPLKQAQVPAAITPAVIPIAKMAKSKSFLTLAESFRGGGRSASAGRNQHRSQNALVVVQVALALVLLIGSGLMIRTFQNLRNVQPGFTDPATIQSVSIALSAVDIPEPERVTRVQQDILDRLASIPGVTSAAYIDALPMEPNRLNAIVAAEGKNYGPKGIPPTDVIAAVWRHAC